MLQLDAVQTLAFAGLALFLGYGLCRVVPVLGRYNLPPPVIGGLVVALAAWAAHARDATLFTLDTGLQSPLMIAFFTTIGMNASVWTASSCSMAGPRAAPAGGTGPAGSRYHLRSAPWNALRCPTPPPATT